LACLRTVEDAPRLLGAVLRSVHSSICRAGCALRALVVMRWSPNRACTSVSVQPLCVGVEKAFGTVCKRARTCTCCRVGVECLVVRESGDD
jgi:hypothetical protein